MVVTEGSRRYEKHVLATDAWPGSASTPLALVPDSVGKEWSTDVVHTGPLHGQIFCYSSIHSARYTKQQSLMRHIGQSRHTPTPTCSMSWSLALNVMIKLLGLK